MLNSSRCRLLLINQSVGSLFEDVVTAGERLGDVAVFQGVAYSSASTITRQLTWILFSIQLAWYLFWRGRRYSHLLVVSNPPFAPLLAPLARRPYSVLLYDLYPQVLDQLQPHHPLQRRALGLVMLLWHEANRRVFLKAERIFTLSSSMAEQLKPYFPTEALWRERVLVIPPWADTANICRQPAAAQIFRHKYGVRGLLLSYSGNLGLTHPIEPFLEACALLEAQPTPPQVQMFLIGDGAKRASLQKQAHSLHLPPSRLRFLDRLPYNELSASLSAADLAVVALDGPAAASSLPSKTFNALACGTPLLALAPTDSALAQLVLQHNCGVVIEPGPSASKQLVDLVMRLAANPAVLQKLASNALAASHHYTSKNADRLVEAWLGPLAAP